MLRSQEMCSGSGDISTHGSDLSPELAVEQRVMVAIGPGSGGEAAIRWAHQLATMLKCPWMALCVCGADRFRSGTEARLAKKLDLARSLGAETLTATDDDGVRGLARIVRQWNVSHLVVGNATASSHWWWNRDGGRQLRRLLRQWDGGVQIHLLGDDGEFGQPSTRREIRMRASPVQYFLAVGAVALITGAAFLFTPIVGPHATALVYLLTVVLLAQFVERGAALAAAALSALCWDYFFLPPQFAFAIHSFEDAMLFGMYFVVALSLGQLTARIKAQQEAERQREARATALYLLTRGLNEARTIDGIVAKAREHIGGEFRATVVIALGAEDETALTLSSGLANQAGDERAIVQRVLESGRPAGRGTDEFPEASTVYVPMVNSAGTIGAVGLRLGPGSELSLPQRMLLEAFSQQIALAFERLRLNELSEEARVYKESERLSKTLLDSMSHELRTPVAAIRGAAGNLLELGDTGLSPLHRQMMEEISEATERLDRLLGNALDINRLESGAVKPRYDECAPAELVHLCVDETSKRLAGHEVIVRLEPNLPVMRMDFVLTQQALSNLLSNAAIHTPPGSQVEVSARIEQNQLVLAVADRGRGIDPEALPRLFDKFYRAPGAAVGGTGLGLSLVRGFVEAQGGTVQASNQTGGGAVFTIRLPLDRSAPAGESRALALGHDP